MRGEQKNTAAKLASLKSEWPYQFRKKGHEEQHAFNASVQGRLVEAGLQLNRVERGVAEGAAQTTQVNAKQALQEGEDLITQRQKLIKVADRSELGWAVVAEYQADELGDNSDDERKLEHAERATERRMAGKKRKMDTAKGRRQSQLPARKDPLAIPLGAVVPVTENPVVPQRPLSFSCFSCGQVGQMQRDCPKRSLVTGVYPLLYGESTGEGGAEGSGVQDNVGGTDNDLEGLCRFWEFQSSLCQLKGGSSRMCIFGLIPCVPPNGL